MARFVVGCHQPLTFIENFFSLISHQDLVASGIKVGSEDRFSVRASGMQGRFVDEVFQFGSRETDGAGSNLIQIDIVRQRDFPRMDFQDFCPTGFCRPVDCHMAVKTTGAQQRGVKHIGTVSRRHDDDGFGLLETIHFTEDLIERLLAFVVSAS